MSGLDVAPPEFRRNPFPVYEQLRAAATVPPDPAIGAYFLFEYAGGRQAFADQERLNSSMSRAGRRNPDWMQLAGGV